ncbi:N-acetylmuramoyl-L-alanine amidase [Psychrobacter sp. JCM 18901]|nr:N-acetylmuramoyl-L-alanine amidase [Psychrobacter sp. JCM 18901]
MLSLVGCVTTSTPQYVIDSDSYQATGKSERIKTIVLHYTVSDNERSIKTLTTGNVSAHYLVLDNDDNRIYNLVPESERAWHAGDGGFAGRTILNDTSIGIEIVNSGIKPEYRDALKKMARSTITLMSTMWHLMSCRLKKVAQLVQDITTRYDISPKNIIGHSDMAPSRKIDPGAKFPWERLYFDYGIGAWYDEFDKQFFMNQEGFASATIPEIKQAFRKYGYQINDTDTWDKASRDVVYAFQLHFRAQQPTGNMDSETYAILQALNKKYAGRDDFY